MSKRGHSETVCAIQIKQPKEVKSDEKCSEVGIYHGSDFGEYKQIQIGPSGKAPFDVGGLSSITVHSIQEWSNGISKEAMEFLCKLAEQEREEKKTSRKYCLRIALAYAFKGDQQAIFAKNLVTLLSVPGITDCFGAFSYSEGGNLAEFLNTFPELVAKNLLPSRYDVYVYAENDTLVEHYYADVKHWLIDLNKAPSSGQEQKPIRQCRIKFVNERVDCAEEMLKYFSEDFQKADKEADQRTFLCRIDCPGFVLDEFRAANEKSGEFLALTFVKEQTLKAEEDDDAMDEAENGGADGTDESGGGPKKASRGVSGEAKNGGAAKADGAEKQNDEDEESVVMWSTYTLLRCPKSDFDKMAKEVQCPHFLKRSFAIIY